MGQKVVVIGSGVVGLMSAYSLAKLGADVTVIDSRSGPAEGCSRGNAGILAVGHATAWASPRALLSLLRALAGREPGVRISSLTDPQLWRWGLQFLLHCTPTQHKRNTEKLQRLARMSRELTKAIEADLGLQGLLRHDGGLYLFGQKEQFSAHAASLQNDPKHGHEGVMALQGQALTDREPALSHFPSLPAGGLFSPFDSVGDCHRFTAEASTAVMQQWGVQFVFDAAVEELHCEGGSVRSLSTHSATYEADAFLLATGAETPQLTRSLGFTPAIYPVKGYSGTWEILNPTKVPQLPFVDETELRAVASYDGKLRVTALAEFAARDDLSLPESRVNVLKDYVARHFGDAVNLQSATFWAGQRPATPAGPPYIGRVKRLRNLWINAGHGQLGWTMSAGSGAVVAQAMHGFTPELQGVSSKASWLVAI